MVLPVPFGALLVAKQDAEAIHAAHVPAMLDAADKAKRTNVIPSACKQARRRALMRYFCQPDDFSDFSQIDGLIQSFIQA